MRILLIVLAIGAIPLAFWQGVSYLYRTLTTAEQTQTRVDHAHKASLQVLTRVHQVTSQLTKLQGGIPAASETSSRTRANAAEAIQELAKGTDERSKAVYGALKMGNTAAAEALYKDILEEKLQEGRAANREAADVARKIAALARISNLTKAADFYAHAVKLDPENINNLIDLGDVRLDQGKLTEALQNYNASLAIADRKFRADPENANWRHGIGVSQNRIGRVRHRQRKLSAAMGMHRASLEICDHLQKSNPLNPHWRRDCAISLSKISDVYAAQGELAGALENYNTALTMVDDVAGADPNNVLWQSDVLLLHTAIGDLLFFQNDLSGALEKYRLALAMSERAGPANLHRTISGISA